MIHHKSPFFVDGYIDWRMLGNPTNKSPRKLKDLGGFMIPCVIRNSIKESSFANLCASINVMPY